VKNRENRRKVKIVFQAKRGFSLIFTESEKPGKRLNLAEFWVFGVGEFTIINLIGRNHFHMLK
jgi:hypothetical protein